MLDYILHLDTELFLLLNSAQCAWLNPVMVFFSKIMVWAPLYVAIVFFFFYKRDWKTGLLMLAAVLLAFALTDRLSVVLFKDTVQRLRPCHAMDLGIHLLEGCGGRYGFLSSHAASTFGLAAITSLLYRRKWYTWSIFAWATVVSYSRIYVGKHYPLDVLCGAAFGMLIGYLVYLLYKKVQGSSGEKVKGNQPPLCL